MKKMFVIMPVRNAASDALFDVAAQLFLRLLEDVYDLYIPARDTNQEGTEEEICKENEAAIREADLVMFLWDGVSQGCLFDLGIAFAAGKPIRYFDRLLRPATADKSFQNLVRSIGLPVTMEYLVEARKVMRDGRS